MSEFIIETKNITYFYEGSKVPSLKDVSIGIRKNTKTILLGANGAGKSTLFYHFNGVVKPESGKILFDGSPIGYRGKALKQLRSRIAVVLQNPDDQIFGQTVEADVAYGPTNIGLPQSEIDARVDEALGLVGLGDLRDRNTTQLSYGQRKRLSLAGALAMKPEVLIMDEPTAGLDPQMALELMELAEELHDAGTAVVISTHDVDLAYAWADEIHVLRRGSLVFSGTSEDFYSDPVNVYTTGLMQPSMYQLNDAMSKMKGVSPTPHPRTETQLISKMAPGRKTGHLVLMPVRDRMDKYMVDAALERVGDDLTIGLYGSAPRSLLSDSQLPVDYVFDGFEACVSDCMAGRDSLLMCSETSMETVKGKIRRLEEFGTPLDWTVIEDPHADSTS